MNSVPMSRPAASGCRQPRVSGCEEAGAAGDITHLRMLTTVPRPPPHRTRQSVENGVTSSELQVPPVSASRVRATRVLNGLSRSKAMSGHLMVVSRMVEKKTGRRQGDFSGGAQLLADVGGPENSHHCGDSVGVLWAYVPRPEAWGVQPTPP